MVSLFVLALWALAQPVTLERNRAAVQTKLTCLAMKQKRKNHVEQYFLSEVRDLAMGLQSNALLSLAGSDA